MPHRILYVIPSLDRSGAEKQLSLLATRLPPDEFTVHVCALTRGGPWQAELERANIPVTVLHKSWKLDPIPLYRLYRLMREWQPDLVHTWIFAANCFGRTAAIAARVPHILAAERCVDEWKTQNELAIDRWLSRWTEAIVVNSRGTQEFYTKHGLEAAPFHVIPNGIDVAELDAQSRVGSARPETDLRHILGLPHDAKLIVTVGRLWPQKRVRDLIWAADLLKGVRADTHLLIVGDGPQRAELERYRSAVQIEDRVHFLGHRSDVPAILPQADCFWLGSGYEGQSNALMEAMALQRPVVATDIPGNRELIQSGVSGFLVPCGDSAEFARKTQMILGDPALAQRLGHAARLCMQEQFRIDPMVASYRDFYRRIVAGSSSR